MRSRLCRGPTARAAFIVKKALALQLARRIVDYAGKAEREGDGGRDREMEGEMEKEMEKGRKRERESRVLTAAVLRCFS